MDEILRTEQFWVVIVTAITVIVITYLTVRADRRAKIKEARRTAIPYTYHYVQVFSSETEEEDNMNHYGAKGYKLLFRHPDPDNANMANNYVDLTFEMKIHNR